MLVFNDLSGASHLLDADGYALLNVLQGMPDGASVAHIAAQLTLQFDEDEPIDIATIELMLANLWACELVEAMP